MKYKIGLKSDRIDTDVHPIGQTCRQTVAPICVNHFSLQTLIGQFENVSNLVTNCGMDLCQLRAICDFQWKHFDWSVSKAFFSKPF